MSAHAWIMTKEKTVWYVWLPVGIVAGLMAAYLGVVIYLSKGVVFGRRRR